MKKILVLLTAMTLVGGLLSTSSVNAQEAPAADPFACGELFTDPAADVDQANLDVIRGGLAATDDASFTATMQMTNLDTTVPTDATGLVWYFWWTFGDVERFASATYSIWTDEVTYGVGEINAAGQLSTTGATEGTFTEGANGSISIVVPYEAVGQPASGDVLSQVYAESRVRLSGPAGPGFVAEIDRAPDGEAYGTDITAGSCASAGPVGEPPVVDPPPVDPPVKKKKKKKKCRAFVPGEMGAEAETVKVTDAHTAEAPLIVPVTLGQDFDEGIQGDPPTHTVNVQVDPKAKSTGLYATFEFPARRDYDLWAFYPTGEEAASSHGFSPLIETQGAPAVGPVNLDQSNTASNHAGETKVDSENIVGVITPDCGGYTMQVQNFFGEGGDFELKLFLGEGKTAPKEIAPEEEGGFPTASRLGLGALFSLL